MAKKVYTGKTLREIVGTGSVIDPHHEGGLTRPVERFLTTLDSWSPQKRKTPEDFRKEAQRRVREEKPVEPSQTETGE